MCQWLPLPSVDVSVCFACLTAQSQARFLVFRESVKLVRIHDRFWPSKEDFEGDPHSWEAEMHYAIVRAVNVNAEYITWLYAWWLGQKMLEEL